MELFGTTWKLARTTRLFSVASADLNEKPVISVAVESVDQTTIEANEFTEHCELKYVHEQDQTETTINEDHGPSVNESLVLNEDEQPLFSPENTPISPTDFE